MWWTLSHPRGQDDNVLLISWNVRFQSLSTQLDNAVAALEAVRPDIITLQEVKANLADTLVARLGEIGLGHAYDSVTTAPEGKHGRKIYQCVIASRWPVEPRGDKWRRAAPFPELIGRATVSTPDGDLDVFTAHIPNGAGNGWKKIDTFNVLSAALRRADDSPRVLTGDFNEPRHFRRSGQIVTWGETIHKDGGTSSPAWKDKDGDERPGIEWTNGVRSVLAGASQHGLRDAYRDLHGYGSTPVTHYTSWGNPRCFDHTYVSRHLDVLSCGYFHEWREAGWSDHSAMWTNMRLTPQQPALVEWDETADAHDEVSDE